MKKDKEGLTYQISRHHGIMVIKDIWTAARCRVKQLPFHQLRFLWKMLVFAWDVGNKNHKISKMWFSDPCIRAVSSSVTNAYPHISPTLSAHKLRTTDIHSQQWNWQFLYKGPGPIRTTDSAHRKQWGDCIFSNTVCPNFMILLDPICWGVTANPTSTLHCRGHGGEVAVVLHWGTQEGL